MRPRSLIILDLDGVLLDLPLDTELVRRRIRALFAAHGVYRSFRPLLATLESECRRIAAEDPGGAVELRARAWEIIDQEERRAARAARLVPGAEALLRSLEVAPLALFTNNHEDAVRDALATVGLSPELFFALKARREAASLKPSAAPLLEIVGGCPGGPPEEVFLLGDHPADMESARLAAQAAEAGARPRPRFIPIGLCRRDAVSATALVDRVAALDNAGAWFIAADLEEAQLLLGSPGRRDVTFSFVLLAFNEAASIARAVEEARRFGELYLGDFETIVVDDGSSDDSATQALAAGRGEVRVVRHETNLGMGAAMRDGYLAAGMDFMAHLPADRQVRASALIHFLGHLAPERVVLSRYVTPPSGEPRRWLSLAFRWLVQNLGGLGVDFAGTYVFGRRWLESLDLRRLASDTFLFSFELLQDLQASGASFHEVAIYPFPRAVGASREVTLRRMAGVFREIVRCRWRRMLT